MCRPYFLLPFALLHIGAIGKEDCVLKMGFQLAIKQLIMPNIYGAALCCLASRVDDLNRLIYLELLPVSSPAAYVDLMNSRLQA